MKPRRLLAALCFFYLSLAFCLASPTLKQCDHSLQSLDQTLNKADLPLIITNISEILKLEPEVVADILVVKKHKLSTLVAAHFLAEKAKKPIALFLPATGEETILSIVEKSEVSLEEMVERLDSVQAEISFAALDLRDKKKNKK